jgi:Domain of unknown function (DUF4263)
MVPGASGVGMKGKLGPIHDAVITQPVLPGLERPQPDFMWIHTDSVRVLAVLVEIEKPSKRWFTKDGRETAQLSQAMSQIAQWKAWFKEPDNVNQFRRLYQVMPRHAVRRVFEQFYLLVYGRQQELIESPEFNLRRRSLLPPDIERMTYDRLAPDPSAANYLCARIRKGTLEAVTVPPTLQLGPYVARDLAPIHGKPDAALRSPYLSEARKLFLAERFEYWDSWVRDIDASVIRMSDWE